MARKPIDPAALSDVELIRARPAMFIGDTTARGLNMHWEEALDLCLDPAVRGAATRVDVALHRDGSISIQCDGLAPPLTTPEGRTSAGLVRAFTQYRFPEGMKTGTGLVSWFGLLPPLNALSEWFEFTGWDDGKPLHQRFERGLPVGAIHPIGSTPAPSATRIHWRPDPEIFGDATLHSRYARSRLRLDALLAGGLTTTLTEESADQSWHYQYPAGAADFVELLNAGTRPLGEPIHLEHRADWGQLSLGLQYCAEPGRPYYSHSWWQDVPGEVRFFANHRPIESGTPVAAFWKALAKVWSDYLRRRDLLPNIRRLQSPRAIGQCIRAVVSVRVPNPVWGGPVRQALMNDDLEEVIESAFHGALADALPGILDEHPWLTRHVHESTLRKAVWPRSIRRGGWPPYSYRRSRP